MKVTAIRGVCIGPEAHLAPGEEADVDKATANYLASIGAVALEPEPDPSVAPEAPLAESKPKAVKNGKKEH